MKLIHQQGPINYAGPPAGLLVTNIKSPASLAPPPTSLSLFPVLDCHSQLNSSSYSAIRNKLLTHPMLVTSIPAPKHNICWSCWSPASYAGYGMLVMRCWAPVWDVSTTYWYVEKLSSIIIASRRMSIIKLKSHIFKKVLLIASKPLVNRLKHFQKRVSLNV